MQFVNSWTMGVEGADFPDFNMWGKRLLGDVLQPKLAVASICPHDWNLALSFFEDTRSSPLNLREFWEAARRNQFFLFRLFNEQGGPNTRVGEIIRQFWCSFFNKNVSFDAVKGILFDGLMALELLEERFDRAEEAVMKASLISTVLQLVADLDYSLKEAADMVGMGMTVAVLRRERARRRSLFTRGYTPVESAVTARDSVLAHTAMIEGRP